MTSHPDLLGENGFVDWEKLFAYYERNPGCTASEVFCGTRHTCVKDKNGHKGLHWDCVNMETWDDGHEQDCCYRERCGDTA